MVVIAAGRYEQRPGVAPHGHVEPQHAAVESLDLAQLGDLQVDVADPSLRARRL